MHFYAVFIPDMFILCLKEPPIIYASGKLEIAVAACRQVFVDVIQTEFLFV